MCPVSNFFEFQFQILLTPVKEYIEHFCCIDKCYEVIPKLF